MGRRRRVGAGATCEAWSLHLVMEAHLAKKAKWSPQQHSLQSCHASSATKCKAQTVAAGWAPAPCVHHSGSQPWLCICSPRNRRTRKCWSQGSSSNQLTQDLGAGLWQWVFVRALQVVLPCSQGWHQWGHYPRFSTETAVFQSPSSSHFPPPLLFLSPHHPNSLWELSLKEHRAEYLQSWFSTGYNPLPTQETSGNVWRHFWLSPLGKQWLKARDVSEQHLPPTPHRQRIIRPNCQ